MRQHSGTDSKQYTLHNLAIEALKSQDFMGEGGKHFSESFFPTVDQTLSRKTCFWSKSLFLLLDLCD